MTVVGAIFVLIILWYFISECNWSAWWSPNRGKKKKTETQMVRPHLKILWHVEDNSAGDMKGARRRGRQKKRWADSIKEWTGMGFGDSLRAAEDREGWKGIVGTPSMVPRRPTRIRDWDDEMIYYFYVKFHEKNPVKNKKSENRSTSTETSTSFPFEKSFPTLLSLFITL